MPEKRLSLVSLKRIFLMTTRNGGSSGLWRKGRKMDTNSLKRIEDIINEKVRPVIESHGGKIVLCGYENGIVTVSLQGACSGCPSSDLGTKGFIENILSTEIPEVERVELDYAVSPDLMAQARQILFGKRAG